MAYSAREHVIKRLQASKGSPIAVDERDVTAILNLALRRIVNNPQMSAKAAVAACFAD